MVFLCGGLIYMGLELLWRRRTHISMGIAGGVCAAALWAIFSAWSLPAWGAYIAGALIISAVELAVGLIVNVRLELGVWSYSSLPFNLYGQICLKFSLLWGLLGVAVWGAQRLIAP